ncbi:Hypothetical protein PFREUD_01000 [Propionibacterium freudenreichii subsp. shermanii CIRM-BIA1]|uniref:Uncharacterized protein n=1 Tax=Propionibacterium freudenreichii subsp. shermanii (strain ATCC 9614 / DSM 4902 / CIP 103027 / NCIMB 8099 / CIRM-BIA1) TaxID=754252 RepID=D7GHN2_PROFC|nr:Hypothetical protein PFREUD_01000 [Propionibacterium freudenreichii subsp. shermanii CIRM-BIA1]
MPKPSNMTKATACTQPLDA